MLLAEVSFIQLLKLFCYSLMFCDQFKMEFSFLSTVCMYLCTAISKSAWFQWLIIGAVVDDALYVWSVEVMTSTQIMSVHHLTYQNMWCSCWYKQVQRTNLVLSKLLFLLRHVYQMHQTLIFFKFLSFLQICILIRVSFGFNFSSMCESYSQYLFFLSFVFER